jgi:hypothetical protein
MADSIKNQLSADLEKAKSEGKLRTERIREIVKAAVAGAIAEVKEGSVEIRSIVREAVSVVVDHLQERGQETREEITASIEGALDAVNQKKQQAIAKTQSEIERLQAQVNHQEKELQDQIDYTLADLESDSKTTSSVMKDAIASAIDTIKDSEEAALMRKRYAQLQTQLAILKANLTARYGERYEDVKRYLDDAQNWYQQAQEKAASQTNGKEDWVQQKQSDFEAKMSEAGTALARREQKVRQILKELWTSVTEMTTSGK